MEVTPLLRHRFCASSDAWLAQPSAHEVVRAWKEVGSGDLPGNLTVCNGTPLKISKNNSNLPKGSDLLSRPFSDFQRVSYKNDGLKRAKRIQKMHFNSKNRCLNQQNSRTCKTSAAKRERLSIAHGGSTSRTRGFISSSGRSIVGLCGDTAHRESK